MQIPRCRSARFEEEFRFGSCPPHPSVIPLRVSALLDCVFSFLPCPCVQSSGSCVCSSSRCVFYFRVSAFPVRVPLRPPCPCLRSFCPHDPLSSLSMCLPSPSVGPLPLPFSESVLPVRVSSFPTIPVSAFPFRLSTLLDQATILTTMRGEDIQGLGCRQGLGGRDFECGGACSWTSRTWAPCQSK